MRVFVDSDRTSMKDMNAVCPKPSESCVSDLREGSRFGRPASGKVQNTQNYKSGISNSSILTRGLCITPSFP